MEDRLRARRIGCPHRRQRFGTLRRLAHPEISSKLPGLSRKALRNLPAISISFPSDCSGPIAYCPSGSRSTRQPHKKDSVARPVQRVYPNDSASCRRDPLTGTPFFSLVIPTFNRKDSLLGCLGRLAAQSYPHAAVEAVVVDDGATDGTRAAAG